MAGPWPDLLNTDYASTGAVRILPSSSSQANCARMAAPASAPAASIPPAIKLRSFSGLANTLAAPVILTDRTDSSTQDMVNAGDLQGTAFALPAGDMKFVLGCRLPQHFLPVQARCRGSDRRSLHLQPASPYPGIVGGTRSVRRVADPGDQGHSLLPEREPRYRGPLFRLCPCRAAAHTYKGDIGLGSDGWLASARWL